MSSFRNIKITCPACKKEGTYTVWDSVNVDLDPELKSKVMDGSLFTWVCPNCKKSFNAPYSFLYHDMTHNFMVQFDAERGHIIPFAEYLRVLENELDMNAIAALAAKFREDNPKMNILLLLTFFRFIYFSKNNSEWDFIFSKPFYKFNIYFLRF